MINKNKMSYLQLLILIDYDDIPKRIKCDGKVYVWNEWKREFLRENGGGYLNGDLALFYGIEELASEPLIEVIEE